MLTDCDEDASIAMSENANALSLSRWIKGAKPQQRLDLQDLLKQCGRMQLYGNLKLEIAK